MTRTDIIAGTVLGLSLALGGIVLEITTGTEAPPVAPVPVGELAPGFGVDNTSFGE